MQTCKPETSTEGAEARNLGLSESWRSLVPLVVAYLPGYCCLHWKGSLLPLSSTSEGSIVGERDLTLTLPGYLGGYLTYFTSGLVQRQTEAHLLHLDCYSYSVVHPVAGLPKSIIGSSI